MWYRAAGAAFTYQYEKMLRQVQYVSKHPEELNSRSFTLVCSVLDGRYTSHPVHITVCSIIIIIIILLFCYFLFWHKVMYKLQQPSK